MITPKITEWMIFPRPLTKKKHLKNKTIQGTKQNGETFIACVSLIPTLLNDHQYLALSIQDISEQHAFEQSLKDEKSRAEKASQAKSEFVANMSHEIRTPLNAVLGSAQLLDNTSPSAIQKQYIQMIRSAGESLLAVINDILDFSKIESGQLEIVCSPFSLEEVITRVSVMMRMNIGEKPIIPVIDIDPNLPSHYHGDALRLQQVLINLVSNAIKFTQQGEVTLSIKSAKTPQTTADNHIEPSQDTESNEAEAEAEADKVLMHFSVSDSGIGIKPDQLQNLFKAFSQADASITRRFGGTGLGLVISNRIVGLMGSDIQVNSTYGQGTTFHFTIYLTPIDFSETEALSAATPPISDSETILIIEAHNASRQSILSILNSRFNAGQDDAKYQTIFYPSSQDYLDFIQTCKTPIRPVDVAILNWESCQSASLLLKVIDTLQNQNPNVRLLVSCASNQHEQTLLNLKELPYDNIAVKPFTRFAFLEQLFSITNSQSNADLNSLPATLRSGIRVLLVEDTVLNQTIAEEMLKDMGATCDIANNGAEAIALYADHHDKYDIIIGVRVFISPFIL